MISPNDRDLARLRELCEQSAPPEPSAERWATVGEAVRAGVRPSQLVRAERRRKMQRTIGMLSAVAAAVLLAVFLSSRPDEAQVEVFPVATAAEIEIISVAGPDVTSLAVGELPMQSPLQLLGPGEVMVTSIQPSDRDIVRSQPHDRIPMIWARLDTELDD